MENIKAAMIKKLENAGLYPLRAEAETSLEVLKERLKLILPWAMNESGVDLWVIAARENNEDPLHKTLYTWDMPLARRTSIIVFAREKGVIRKYYLGMACESMTEIYENPMLPGETVWQTLARLINETAPQRIAVNRSRICGFCDGISSTLYEQVREAAGSFSDRITDGDDIATRWLERITPMEKKLMETLASVTQDVIKACFSRLVITPGATTTEDVSWAMRDLIHGLGYKFWFGPDVNFQRRGSDATMNEGLIMPGDLLHCDIGIYGTFIKLYTDMQWLAYILKDGETAAPDGMQKLLDDGNRFRQIVTDSMEAKKTGDEVFKAAMDKAKAEGIKPWLYSHTVGTFGHGAGPVIGMYDNQSGFVSGNGERMLETDMVYALELNVCGELAEWDGQNVYMYLEENICHDAEKVYYLAEQQKEFLLV